MDDKPARPSVKKKAVPQRQNPTFSDDRPSDFLNRLIQEWRVTFDTLKDAVVLIDSRFLILRCNRAMADLLGYSFEHIIGRDLRRFFSEMTLFLESLGENRKRMTDSISARGRWYRISADPLVEENGFIRGWACIVTDFTESRDLEENMRRSEERFRLLFEHAPIGISVFRDARILFANRVCKAMFAVDSGDELTGTRIDSLIESKSGTGFHTILDQWEVEKPEEKPREFTGIKKNGNFFPVDIQISTIHLSDGPAKVAFITDLTERKMLEDRLIQAQKMESLGQLASGIAHDFNNILTGIVGYADMALIHVHQPHPLHEAIFRIRQMTDRASSITRKLLAFSRKQKLEFRYLNLNQVIHDLLKLLYKTLGEDIEIDFSADANLQSVFADVSQMEQVLMNLCLNARDAMPNGGKLSIHTRTLSLEERTIWTHPAHTPGEYILLEVADTGEGMDKDILPRIFEPFFTTKEPGKGTGLGLSMVHGIITQQGGFIEVQSEKGKWTIFRIYLPAVSRREESEEILPKKKVSGGGETLLVVEDDEDVLELVITILQDLGYRIISAREGEEGLKIYQENREQIDLIITDVIMPKFSGRQLQEEILRINPQGRILFISGYTANEFDRMPQAGEVDFLQKPFSPHQLTTKVREILDR